MIGAALEPAGVLELGYRACVALVVLWSVGLIVAHEAGAYRFRTRAERAELAAARATKEAGRLIPLAGRATQRQNERAGRRVVERAHADAILEDRWRAGLERDLRRLH